MLFHTFQDYGMYNVCPCIEIHTYMNIIHEMWLQEKVLVSYVYISYTVYTIQTT